MFAKGKPRDAGRAVPHGEVAQSEANFCMPETIDIGLGSKQGLATKVLLLSTIPQWDQEAMNDAGNNGGGSVFCTFDCGRITLNTGGLTTTSTCLIPKTFDNAGASLYVTTTEDMPLRRPHSTSNRRLEHKRLDSLLNFRKLQ